MAAIAYRPEVDGLRAVAILAVLFYHIDSKWLPGGFVGVDVFFVISGYLITSIIFEETQSGSFTLQRFYARRIRRLFPAMAGLLITVLAAGAIFDPLNFAALRTSVLWVALLGGNLHIWKATGDYWGPGVDAMPLLHTWSLAVEEQFYMAFPITLMALLRWQKRRTPRILLILAVASFVCSLLLTPRHPPAAFYLPPTRAWELLAGCFLAVFPLSGTGQLARHRHAGTFAGAGLVMIFLSYLVVHGGQGFPGYRAALPVLGSMLVIAFTGTGASRVECILRRPWIVFVGKASYSLYLWHWPVIVFLKGMQDNPAFPAWFPTAYTGLFCVVFSFALALSSYWFIERPLRAWSLTPLMCACIFLGLIFTLVVIQPRLAANNLKRHNLAEGFAPMTDRGRFYSVNQVSELSPAGVEQYRLINMLIPTNHASLEEGIIRKYGPGPIQVAVFGDSHCLRFAPLIDGILRSNHLSGCFFCADAAPPNLFRDSYVSYPDFGTAADLKKYDESRQRFLAMQKPKVSLWIQRYDNREFEDFRKSIQYVVEHSTCVVFQQLPVLNIGDVCTVNAFGYFRNLANKTLSQLNIVEKRWTTSKRRGCEAEILREFKGHPRFRWLDTNDEFLEPNGHIRWWDGKDRLYYIDDDHLSEYGVQLLGAKIERAILDALAAKPPP